MFFISALSCAVPFSVYTVMFFLCPCKHAYTSFGIAGLMLDIVNSLEMGLLCQALPAGHLALLLICSMSLFLSVVVLTKLASCFMSVA